MRVANAPCSWGVLEFDGTTARTSAHQMLGEMAATGYIGTELGEWGFLPTDPAELSAALDEHALALVGAFVPVRLADGTAAEAAVARAVRIARLLASVAGSEPLVVLSDDNATDPRRTERAGRIQRSDALAADQWDAFASRASRIAHSVREATGLRTVFHHHCAGYVETVHELAELMSRTEPGLLGLCLDTGHLTYGGGDPVTTLRTYRERVWHVHVKDCNPAVAGRARADNWDYHQALRRGIFCELGCGGVDLAAFVEELRQQRYSGWIVVEQDMVAGGSPAQSAARNRAYLRSLGV
jgi:inosose dehydratase